MLHNLYADAPTQSGPSEQNLMPLFKRHFISLLPSKQIKTELKGNECDAQKEVSEKTRCIGVGCAMLVSVLTSVLKCTSLKEIFKGYWEAS